MSQLIILIVFVTHNRKFHKMLKNTIYTLLIVILFSSCQSNLKEDILQKKIIPY